MRALLHVSLFSLIAVSSLAGAALAGTPSKADRERNKKAPVVAVFSFKVLNKEDNYQHLGEGAADAIVNKIVNDKALRIVEESQLDKAVKALERNQSGLFEEESYLDIGKMVDARFVVIGSVQVAGEQVAVNARLLEVETRQLIAAERVVKPLSDVLGAYDELAARALSKMTFHLAQRVAGGESADEIAVRQLIDEAKSFDPLYPEAKGVTKDLARALAAYNKAVLRDPRSAVAQLALGHAESRMSQQLATADANRSAQLLQSAKDHLLRSTEIDADNAYAWNELGRCYGRLNKHDDARVAFETALSKDANLVAARFGKAVALFNLGNLNAAREEALAAQKGGEPRATALLADIDQRIALKKEKPNPKATR